MSYVNIAAKKFKRHNYFYAGKFLEAYNYFCVCYFQKKYFEASNNAVASNVLYVRMDARDLPVSQFLQY